jgi:hypothetical protein
MYKSPGSDQIAAKLIQTEGETLFPELHKLINSVWNKEELPDQWKESIILPLYKNGDKMGCVSFTNDSTVFSLALAYSSVS